MLHNMVTSQVHQNLNSFNGLDVDEPVGLEHVDSGNQTSVEQQAILQLVNDILKGFADVVASTPSATDIPVASTSISMPTTAPPP